MKIADKKIMLIDDDPVLRTLLKRVLENVGCVVSSCQSIMTALDVLKTTAPDLIILDLAMPEMNGFNFLRFRHLNKRLASIPVIVLSGTLREEDIQRAMEMGADQFLKKPFETNVILQKIRYIFYSKQDPLFIFEENKAPIVEVEINAEIVEKIVGQFKVESFVRFTPGKSVELHSEDFLKNNGNVLVCKIQNHLVELNKGFYRTVITPIGLDNEQQKKLDDWQKDLS